MAKEYRIAQTDEERKENQRIVDALKKAAKARGYDNFAEAFANAAPNQQFTKQVLDNIRDGQIRIMRDPKMRQFFGNYDPSEFMG